MFYKSLVKKIQVIQDLVMKISDLIGEFKGILVVLLQAFF